MKALSAKVLDSTHLELAEPLSSTVGGWVRIVVTSPEAESADWHRAAKERLLAAYDEQDSIYDDL